MKFDIGKTKSFSISLITEGIDINKMKFKFSIEMNDMIHSFPVSMTGDNLQVIVPPLSEKIKNVKPGTYNAMLETYSLNEANKGYYLRPWEEKIELIKEPKLSVSIKEDVDKSKITATIQEEKDSDEYFSTIPVKTKKIKTFSKFGKILDEGETDKYRCKECGWIYDPKKEGKSFSDQPSTYKCPECGAPKSEFEKV